MNGIVSGFISLKFVQLLSKPFTEWKAYDLGLIDEKGKKIKDAKTSEEKKEFVSWMNIIRKLKMMLNKFAPGGRVQQLKSYAAALYLLKEDIDKNTTWEGSEIINIIAQDIFLVDESLNEVTKLEVLNAGKYVINNELIDKNNLIMIRGSVGPSEWFYGVPMFKLKDTISGNYYTVTKEDLRSI